MQDTEQRKQQFEKLLSQDAYEAAWRYACRLCHAREDAEDLLQESLARAFTRVDKLREPERFKSWLLSIVRSCFLNRYAKQSRERQAQSYWHEFCAAHAFEDPLSLELADALARLPETQSELLGLFYLQGLSLEETGQVLGLSAIVVRQRLFRARGALRRLLSDSAAVSIASQEN
jgi:RNA polymerase sigma-70 factor (ECF subfamily)